MLANKPYSFSKQTCHMQLKYFILLASALFFSVEGIAQNTPLLTEASPSGTIQNMATPTEVNTSFDLNSQSTYIPLVPISNSAAINTSSSPANVKQQLVFMDGFKRPFQSITPNISTVAGVPKHLVQIFDNRVQRDGYSFLSYSSNSQGLQTQAFAAQRSYFNARYGGEGYTAFSKTTNSSSSTQQSVTSFAPGATQVGQGRGAVAKAITNAAGEVRIWELDASGLPVSTSFYGANELMGSETTLPLSTAAASSNPPQSRSYSDREGRLILKMTADGTTGSAGNLVNTWQYTYYIYDVKGNLIYTLPPLAVQFYQAGGFTAAQWNNAVQNLCFKNMYDNKNRLIGTCKPGETGMTWVLYDRRDRMVMRRTPKEEADKEWEVIFYDKRNRVKATSIYKNTALTWDRDTWQQNIDAAGGNTNPADLLYYLSTTAGEAAYPHSGNPYSLTPIVGGNTIMSYNWYDNYKDADLESYYTDCSNKLQFSEVYNTVGAEAPNRSNRVEGMAVGTMVRVLRSPNALAEHVGDWRVGITYYDDKGRVINTVSFTDDETSGAGKFNFDYAGMKYDFAGRVLLTKHVTDKHNAPIGQPGYAHTELTKYEYDGTSGSLLRTVHQVDGGAWNTLSKIDYDDIGRVARNDLGGGGEVQDFSYNIRGQLMGINGLYAETGTKGGVSRTFGESLKYDYGFTQPRYDSKIAGMVWRGSSATNMYAYGYTYGQDLSLNGAAFRYRPDGGDWDKDVLDYTVSNLTYDKNGNIKSMKQRGVNNGAPVDMDNLSYNYLPQSNRLDNIVDNGVANYGAGDFNDQHAGTDYAYDLNGNTTSDLNRDVTTTFTRFNKPALINKFGGGTIEYSYDAAGNKLEEIIFYKSGAYKRTDYIGNCVYQNNSPNNSPDDSLQYMLTSVGRTVFDKNAVASIKEEYFVKDHLGNVRSTLSTLTYSTRNYLASYELASAHLENLVFDAIDELRDTKPGGDGDNTMAANLNGADPERRVGSSLMVHVMAGDKVSMNVNTFFESYNADDDHPILANEALQAIVSTLTGGMGGFPGEGHNSDLVGKYFTGSNFQVFNDLLSNVTDNSKPRAYLNYILFDENMKVVREMTGAFQATGQGGWARVGNTTPMEVPTNGYLAVYLGNNSLQTRCFVCGDVYFDDLRFTVTKGVLLEEAHYYPFGLPINGLSAVTADEFKENRNKYQGNALIKDMELNLMDFQARQYDPQIGRFLSVDPLAAVGGQDMVSPYAAMGNMPESMIDPNGLKRDYYQGNSYMAAETGAGSRGGGASSASGEPGNPIWGDRSTGMFNGPNFLQGFSYMGYSGAALQMYYNGLPTSMQQSITAAHQDYERRLETRREQNAQANYFRSIVDELIYGTWSITKTSPLHYTIEGAVIVRIAPAHVDNFEGFWGKVSWILDDRVGRGSYDWNGNFKGIAPTGGVVPGVGLRGIPISPSGLGSTGRTAAANLVEQMAMKEVMSNPAAGQIIQKMKPLTDPRWPGWLKMQYEHIGLDGSKTIIHYNGQWYNGVLEAVDDFKFK